MKNLILGQNNFLAKLVFIGVALTLLFTISGALSVFAVGTPPSITIDSISDPISGNHTPPFDFSSCQTNPLFNPLTVSGNGTGSAPPGDASQYRVQVDWGDSTVTNGLGTFTPNSGHVNFSFVFASPTHTYTTNG